MQNVKFSALPILPLLAYLCLSATAAGQTITVKDSTGTTAITSMTFTVPANTSHSNSTYQQTLTVFPSNVPTTVQFTPQVSGSWLYINNSNQPSQLAVSSAGQSFTVSVDSTNFPNGFSQTMVLSVCYVSSNVCAPQIPVSLNVTAGGGGGSGNLSSNPAGPLNFTAAAGSSTASPSSTNLQILNSTASLGYTMTPATQTGGNWLLVNGSATSVGGVENSTALPISISSTILPTLGSGTYNGTLTVNDNTNSPFVINVVLTVGAGNSLTPSPLSFQFLYQIGQTQPASQNLTVSSNSNTAIGFTLSTTTSAPWLIPSSLSGSAAANSPATITLNVNTNQLQKGSYSTGLVITPFGQASLPAIPVNLVVSNNPILQLSSSSLTFNAAFAGQSPPAQTVNVTTTGSGGNVGFNVASDQSWLNVSASQNVSPATLTISINSGALSVGTQTGHITVTPTNGDNYSEQILVSLTVSNAAQINVGPSNLLFSYETTKAVPGPQSVLITSTGQPTSFTYNVSTSSCGNNWLSVSSVSSNTTPATLQISVAAAGMAAGVCNGTVAITPSGGTAVNVNVTLAVTTNTPLLTIQQTSGFGVFTMQYGGTVPSSQAFYLGSTDTAVDYGIQFQSDRGWLYTTQTNGNTPVAISANIAPIGLAPGTYGGSITVTSSKLPTGTLNGQFTIPVTLVVTQNVTVTESPASLSFNFVSGATAPAAQNITLTSAGGTASYTANINSLSTCPSGILGISPSSGTANGNIAVSIASTNFTAGTYNCQIAIAYVNSASSPVTVPVAITVTPAVTVTAAPTSLTFAYTVGATKEPASQAVTITSTGAAAQFTVGTTTTSGSGNWLSVDTTSGTTAGTGPYTKTVNVSVNPTGLTGSATGTAYNGTVTISSSVLSTPITIPVTLTVTQPPNPMLTVVTNNASNLAGVIAPGELLTIKGTLLGPATPVSFSLNSSGGVNNTLGGVQVTFDGIAGTPIYVSAGQINVTAPWEIAGRLTTNVVVTYNGNASSPLAVRVSDYAPAIYTLNSTGSGQAAAINQNGTFNGPPGGSTIPATANSVVVLYATGCGQTSPPGTTGSVSPATSLLSVTAPVAVGFGPVSNPLYGKVLFIGAAPGLVTGVCQINVQLPQGLGSGSQFVSVTVGGVSSPQGPTVAVQ